MLTVRTEALSVSLRVGQHGEADHGGRGDAVGAHPSNSQQDRPTDPPRAATTSGGKY
jgi:hypothetical protein